MCSIAGILISRPNRGQSLIPEGRLAGELHLRRDRHHLLNRWNPVFLTQPGQSLIREGRLAGGLHLRRDRHHLLNRWNPDFLTQPGTVPDSGGAAGWRAASPS
jgi:hypothetical protein